MMTYARPIVLECWSSIETHNAGCDVAVLDVTEDLLARANERYALFQHLTERDTDLAGIQFWDDTPHFFTLSAKPAGLEEAARQIDAARLSWFQSQSPLYIPDDQFQRLDACWMEVGNFGVQWKAIPKHGAVQLTTGEVEMTILQTLAPTQSHEIRR